MTIKTVAVIGASGNVGAPLVTALLAAGFIVTAVTRESSTSTFPAGVAVRKADLSSVEALVKAFDGQDAVVATVATTTALGGQNNLIDAAVAAGVKRFIPSEFGLNTRILDGEVLGSMLKGKIGAVDYLIEKANANPTFTWTGIATGLFFDWGLDFGTFGVSFPSKSITVFDSGNEKVSACSLPFIGRAVVSVLQHEVETANKYLTIAELTVSQNEIRKALEEETGLAFTATNVGTQDIEKTAHEKLSKGDHSSFIDFLLVYNFRDGNAHAMKEADLANNTLQLPSTNLNEVIRDYIKSKST